MADVFNLLSMYDDDDDFNGPDTTTNCQPKRPIVDYGLDDIARSPVLESMPEVQQRTVIGNAVYSPQLSAQADVQDGVDVSDEDRKDIDPLDNFLPPPPQEKCLDELQEKINKFVAYKRQGKSFNVEVRNRKDYRNPDFLRHAVRYQDIDEIGSCFSKDVFDPHGYDESDFYDARGVSILPSGGSQSASAESIPREGRHNKKSKWDKVDGDRRSVLGGGHETLSAVSAHALLSAENAGAGYAVCAQHKRCEAEERRSSDTKADKRS